MSDHTYDSHSDRDELYDQHGLALVRYLDRDWPDERLLAEHRRRYPGVPCELWTTTNHLAIVHQVSDDGRLAGIEEHELDDEGEPLAINRRSPDGALIGRTEYVLDDAGEITLTRELDAQGHIIGEQESPD